jgi:hypothetical protein
MFHADRWWYAEDMSARRRPQQRGEQTMSAGNDQHAEQISILNAGQNLQPSRNLGYTAGYVDAQEGKTAMTEAQLGYHGDEYAHGYRAGYAKGLEATLAAAEAELDAIAARAKEAYRKYRTLDNQQTTKATEVRDLRQKIRNS